MQSHIFTYPINYDGSQLHHAFAYERANILGDSIVSFIGSANVREHLVDLEDSLSNDFISSEKMLHYIIEVFNATITEAVLWQRVLVKAVIDELVDNAFNVDGFYPGPLKYIFSPNDVHRKGDDIMIEDDDKLYKLSVSIATLAQFSGLIHLGINIDVGQNCPVKAIGLTQMGYNELGVRFFQEETIKRFVNEYMSIKKATFKVQGV